jgi:hypothetical protein
MTRYLNNSKTGCVKHPEEIEREQRLADYAEILVAQNITLAQKMKLPLFEQIDYALPGIHWYFLIGHVVLKIHCDGIGKPTTFKKAYLDAFNRPVKLTQNTWDDLLIQLADSGKIRKEPSYGAQVLKTELKNYKIVTV